MLLVNRVMVNRFVLDTHIWISIFHRNRTELLIDALENMDITIVSSDEQCKEILDVVSTPNLQGIVNKKPLDYVFYISTISEIYESQKRFTLLTDYKDNYLADLAWQSKSILVSDDKHFAPLKKLKSPKISLQNKIEFYKYIGW
jgi:putative PIN family toxin of toxin-antitoxin system